MKIKKYFHFAVILLMLESELPMQPLKVSDNRRYFQTADGKPFFWLGDTGWLLFKKCKREDVLKYLNTREQQGYNVVQVMVLHELTVTDAYGDSALINRDVSRPNTTEGKSFNSDRQYDYWDNIDFVLEEAAKRGIYIAMVPVWGSNIKTIPIDQLKKYATFLANRYKDKVNIIWLNGGDVKGSDALDKWDVIGCTLRSNDQKHLITYHPRGRNSSSAWFHNASWLDFNMFQSGHRTYAQDTLSNEMLHYGEDNWRYANDDYKLSPTKPTLDGEPSYEDIPYGLHHANQPYWQDYEIRRYAYWSVFAGGCGFTYGNNEVMQFYTKGEAASYFPKISWQEGLSTPAAGQMQYLKKLMLSKNYFDRVPDQSLVIDNGEQYDRVLSTRGDNYAMFYVYNGRDFKVNTSKLKWELSDAYWFCPKDGTTKILYKAKSNRINVFNPPGEKRNGNDWVLILEESKVHTGAK
jgi:Protein of unknown function (DUF4038)/Putative collagen-binding domain of a collagenase